MFRKIETNTLNEAFEAKYAGLSSLDEAVDKEWHPNLSFNHIKNVYEKVKERGYKFKNNEREEFMAAVDKADKQGYTVEERKQIRDWHKEIRDAHKGTNESLLDDIHEADTELLKTYGPECRQALDDYSKVRPEANVYFSEDDLQEFLGWALENGYKLNYGVEESLNEGELEIPRPPHFEPNKKDSGDKPVKLPYVDEQGRNHWGYDPARRAFIISKEEWEAWD